MNIGQGSDRSMDKTTVSNYFRDEDDFKEALEVADRNADTETQMQFVCDCREKFEQYGMNMFFSFKQNRWLYQLARR